MLTFSQAHSPMYHGGIHLDMTGHLSHTCSHRASCQQEPCLQVRLCSEPQCITLCVLIMTHHPASTELIFSILNLIVDIYEQFPTSIIRAV